MFKNLKDGRTTIPTIIGIILTLIGTLVPQWFTDVPVEEISGAMINIANSLGVIIVWVTGLLSRGGVER